MVTSRMIRASWLISAFIFALTAAPTRGTAQHIEPETNASELDAKLAALDAYLLDLQRPTRAYWGTWIAVLGALAVGQGTQAAFEDDTASRAGLLVGAGLSTAGLTLVLIAPTPGRYASYRYRALPSHSEDEKQRKLTQGETWLASEAAAVRRTRSWLTHAIAVTFGVGAGLYLGLAYDDNLQGALRTGIGTFLVTELRVWTRPTRSVQYWRDYRGAPTVTPSLGFMPLLMPRAAGLSVGGMF